MSAVRTMILSALALGGVAVFVTSDPDGASSASDLVRRLTGREVATAPAPATHAERPARAPATRPPSASVVSIPRTNGQFFTTARINRGSVQVLVDTGATAVALTAQDARRSGIDMDALVFDQVVSTANGQTRAARQRLDEVRIGGIVVRDVDALVLDGGLHISLLGMSFLGELQKVEATPSQLILRQ